MLKFSALLTGYPRCLTSSFMQNRAFTEVDMNDRLRSLAAAAASFVARLLCCPTSDRLDSYEAKAVGAVVCGADRSRRLQVPLSGKARHIERRSRPGRRSANSRRSSRGYVRARI